MVEGDLEATRRVGRDVRRGGEWLGVVEGDAAGGIRDPDRFGKVVAMGGRGLE